MTLKLSVKRASRFEEKNSAATSRGGRGGGGWGGGGTSEDIRHAWSANSESRVRRMRLASKRSGVRTADIALRLNNLVEIMTREWLEQGSRFSSWRWRGLDPAGWVRMDKVIVDMLGNEQRMPGVLSAGMSSKRLFSVMIASMPRFRKIVAGNTARGATHSDERYYPTRNWAQLRTILHACRPPNHCRT